MFSLVLELYLREDSLTNNEILHQNTIMYDQPKQKEYIMKYQ